jgi:hypothetical protein
MPLPKTVTAQDFINLCESTNVHDEVDALLSRARQEAVEEYKQSLTFLMAYEGIDLAKAMRKFEALCKQ